MAIPNMIVTLAANTTKFVKSMQGASTFLGKFGRFATSVLQGIATTAAIAFAKFSIDSIKAASSLEQAIGGTEAVFGKFAAEVEKNAQSAAKNIGLSMEQYNRLGAMTGTLLKNAGVPLEKLAGQTDTLLTLASDLAATFGGTVEEAATAMNSALRGEFEPIRRFGIALSQAQINQEALRMSGKKSADQLTKQEKILATQSLLLKQGADASGQFARESDTLAGKQQILNAQWSNLSAILGEKLLPFAQEVVGELSDWISSPQGKQDLADMVQAFKDIAAALKEAYNFVKDVKKFLDDITKNNKWFFDGLRLWVDANIPNANTFNSGNPSAPGGPRPTTARTPVVVNFNTPVDSVSAGREIARVLSDYDRARGR